MTTALRAPAAFDTPAPVQRYLDTALGCRMQHVRLAEIGQTGEFLLRAPGLWRPFTATHRLTVAPPGFVWDADIRVLPGIGVHVRDSFVNGVGAVHARLLGVFTLSSMQGTPDLAAGSLQRYLAEAAWCPPALLPGNGVTWAPLDGSSARAAIVAGGTRVTLDFHFRPDGLIERVYSPSRPRIHGSEVAHTPWQGRFEQYAERGGFIIPLAGEVEWLLPAGPQPYWRGRITSAAFA